MENKKISFGFSKFVKKPAVVLPVVKDEEKKVELIDCLENQSIKIKNAVVVVAEEPLIIPLKDNRKNLADRIREYRQKNAEKNAKQNDEDNRPDSELTLDEWAARQLVQEAKEMLNNGSTTTATGPKVSLVKLNDDTPTLEGASESTLDDYESVPIEDFGLAMLRGMGWKDGMAVGKNGSKSTEKIPSTPEVRPKGLGLGAERIIHKEREVEKRTDKEGNELVLVKGGYGKIIAGIHRGYYCKVQGFDGNTGFVVVRISQKNIVTNLSEFLVVAVSEKEFAKGSKIINNAKYEDYVSKYKAKESMGSNGDNNIGNRTDNKSYSEEVRIKREERRRSSSESDHKSYKQKEHKSKKKNKKRSRSRSRDRKEKTKKHKHHKRSHSSDSDYEKSSSSKRKHTNKYR